MTLKILLASSTLTLIALAAESGTEMYQRAVTQERAGKMEEAIKLYEKVAHDFAGSDRALAAKALVQAARDYEKLGQDQAVKLYEKVARDFGDQREQAAAANARLTVLRQPPPPPTMTQRKIEPISGDPEPYSDARHVVYRDADAHALIVADLDGGNKRVIFKYKSGELLDYLSSKDVSMVFLRTRGLAGPVINAVIKIDGTGYRELFEGYPYGAGYVTWSWDNRYLLFSAVPPGPVGAPTWGDSVIPVGGGVVVVSVSDGKAREVVRREASVFRAAFSPDGRFIAFSEGPPAFWTGKTFVVPVEGGEPRLISSEASLLDWTRDGRYLAVSSTRSGSAALWLLPVRNGQSTGDPVFVRNGGFMVGETVASGGLRYQSVPAGSKAALVATLDSNGRLGAWKPLELKISGNNGVRGIQWSPDSTQIVYYSAHDDAGQPGSAIRVHNVVSGEDREVYRSTTMLACGWEAHRPNLLCSEGVPTSAATAVSMLSVGLDSGHAERLGSVSFGAHASDEVRQFARERGIELLEQAGTMGPDSLARVVNGRDLEIRATHEDEWKHLVSLNSDQSGLFPPAYSFDRKWIFYGDKDASGKDSLFRISTEGGQPELLGDLPAQYHWTYRLVEVSPDGRNILIEGTTGGFWETWQIENFEPKPPGAR